ncbi:TonB-dependent hemoglobin/transferrin/lactoferrin family receptor [Mannheimia massilioguelmaensis]|uniref:TonB-dependent hemoglobin/transferrin/lactoferrin family receptor n=1 Tax=Mannheimia massilioguelmaensis TaxID=1604354 RepID=UPI0005C91BFA|nr:TonB-dependent hemoglobin/transferrin/lactoferrin family receptor [Mannheimia massilioguelmaensis]
MKLSKIYLALISSAIITGYADANPSPDQIELDAINVTATRDPSKFADTPQKQNKDELLTKQATSVAAALKDIPNVDIQGGARAIAQKPSIRGLSDNRVVQVIDGVRQNFDLAHRGSYFIPMSLIQEVEVIKGPSSSLWGSGALGGVVAIRTPSALDLLKNNQKFGAKIRQGYQTANNLSESEVSVFAANDKFDALITGFHNDADNLRTGEGRELNNTAYKQTGGLAKFGWQINDNNRLELSHRQSQFKQTAPSNNEAENEFTNAQIMQKIAAFHATHPTPQQMIAFYSQINSLLGSVSYLSDQKINDKNTALNYYFNPNSPYVNAQFTLYSNSTEEKEQRKLSGVQDKTKLTTQGFNLRNHSDFSWLSLVYGMDYMRDKVNTKRGTNSSDAQYRANPYDAKSNTTGIYLIAHIPLFSESLVLSPSLRYDHFKTSSESTQYTVHHWSPAVKLTVKPTQWLDLTAKYNEAFRAPSMQERFVSGSHFGTNMPPINNIFLTNPNLRPETAKNKEITANFHFNNLIKQGDKVNFEATYFRNDIKDLINLQVFKMTPASLSADRSQYQNIKNARLSGIELQTQYQTDRLAVFANYGSTKGKDKDTGEALSNIAATKIGFGMNYALVKDKFTVGAKITRYNAQNRVPTNHGITYEGYTLTDLQATYAPLKGEWENLRLDVAVENLFDKKYQPAFSLMEGTGRNVKMSVTYTF